MAKQITMPAPVWRADGALTICLPMPSRKISPNGQRGQSKSAAIMKSRLVKKHRYHAFLATKSALAAMGCPPAFRGYSLAFFFKTAAYRDDDNADASCKAYRDGMADALGVDDRTLRKCHLSTHAKDAACPRVEITLHPKKS